MELLEKILDKENFNEAYKHVEANKGAPGVDGVTVDEAYENIAQNKEERLHQIRKATTSEKSTNNKRKWQNEKFRNTNGI